MSMQVIDEDQYTSASSMVSAATRSRRRRSARATCSSASARWSTRTIRGCRAVHALQDAITIDQPAAQGSSRFRIGTASQSRSARRCSSCATLPDTRRMFGAKDEVDPVRRLIGAASAWGGNPPRRTRSISMSRPRRTTARPSIGWTSKDVPVDGFWSISVYNARAISRRTARRLHAQQHHREKERRRLGRDPVRRLRRQDRRTACRSCRAGTTWCASIARAPEILNGTWKFPGKPTS